MTSNRRPDFAALEQVEVLLIKSSIRGAYIRAEFRRGQKRFQIEFMGGELSTKAMECLGVDPNFSYRPFWDVFLETDSSEELGAQGKVSLCGQLLYGAYQVVEWKV